MRRRLAPVLEHDLDGIPPELRAGPCVEVWAPAGGDYPYTRQIAAWRHWSDARDLWAADRGLMPYWDRDRLPEVLQHGRSAWSFEYLASNDLHRLAVRLEMRGLPRDWTPAPATDPRWSRPRPSWPTWREWSAGRGPAEQPPPAA